MGLARPLRPEVLAPAGDLDALKAALAAGADSVYFGLAEGFNARARAGNFTLEGLEETVGRVHRAGARAFLTLNTLVFETELAYVAELVRRAAQAGVDALIVQDPAVALIAREVCPELEVHASTQMTISSAEGARFAASLGVTRVVVPRELSLPEIRAMKAGTELELEVFVHGALCVAWSGQCLTSATWSGRSANRGECAQSCRLPYELVIDGETRDLGDVKYLLSPKDLAGLRAVEDLREIGVHGLKIEGRQKSAQYVLTTTQTYRHWVDALEREADKSASAAARADLLRSSLAFTRGFGDGFFGGSDHQTLVEGRFPKHRGVYLGRVARVDGSRVTVERDGPDDDGRPWTGALAADEERSKPCGTPSAAQEVADGAARGLGGSKDASDGPRAAELEPRAGMGIVFDAGDPEDQAEPGGPIFGVDELCGSRPRAWVLRFGIPGPDLSRVAPGQRAWISGDPALARETAQVVEGDEPTGRIELELVLRGREGEFLVVDARARHARARAQSLVRLTRATGGGLDATLVREKLAAFGGTPFRLASASLEELEPGLHLPVSELKALRRRLVDELLPQIERGRARAIHPPSLPRARARTESSASASASVTPTPGTTAQLVALCRSSEQLEAAIEAGLDEVELDWMELVGLAQAVTRARAAGLRVVIATVRVQKPGEEGYDRRLAALEPDAVLVRHWGALVHFAEMDAGARPRLIGDFSLNVTNSITAAELLARGLDGLTPSHDLDRDQLLELLGASEPARFTVVLQHHIPTFHTEHCVYAHLLSHGRDFRTCGRPCETHQVSLRDQRGREHPVIVDVGCRNTVFNAERRSAAEIAGELAQLGVRRFRVEFVRETRAQAREVLGAYAALLAGRSSPRAALQRAAADGRVGVTDGAMALMRAGGASGETRG